MPIIPIQHASDPRIAPYADLRNKRLRYQKGRFIAEGELVVRRLLDSGHQVESLLVEQRQLARWDVPEYVDVYCAPRNLLQAIVGFPFHRGCLACGIRPASGDLADRVPSAGQSARVVVCAAVNDPENLGGILRNCAALGVDLVVAGVQGADPYSRRALRVSMATSLYLTIHQSAQLEADVRRLRDEFGFHLAATVLDPSAMVLGEEPVPSRLGLLFGNEMHGLDPQLVALCQSRWTIPMESHTDSLNVAVASGIFLYHARYSTVGMQRASSV